MKTVAILIVALIFLPKMSAQECNIPIAVAMPEHMEGLEDVQKDFLLSKMEQLVVSQGIASDFSHTQFVLTADVIGIQKGTVPTIPVSMTCQCDVVFKLLNRTGMKTIAIQTVNVRGAGNSETKAMQNAMKLINSQNKSLVDFIRGAKIKVLTYYNQHASQILSQARTLANLDKYEEAFNQLAAVPECCNQYEEITHEMIAVYPKARDKVGENCLKRARMIWTVGQTSDSAADACYWLSLIDPKSSAHAGGEKLYAEIKLRVNEELQFKMKVYDDNVDLIKEQINAAKEIGMAYGKGQKMEINLIK